MTRPFHTVPLDSEQDVVTARQRARDIAARLGFETQDQTRIATALSEIARNAVAYAGGGRVEYAVALEDRAALSIVVSDSGPGIPDLRRILEGRYRSATGMGLGILGARRLMDAFDIHCDGSGTRVRLVKRLPGGAAPVTPERLAAICEEMARLEPHDLLDELRQENHELLRVMDELRARQEELSQLNTELMETNRGVVALTKELEESAINLKHASEAKTRFLSYMSHEFRTPLNSILALSRLLLEQTDGPLTPEQQKQVGFVRQSAETLLEIVGDLLDLAKMEAGRTPVRPSQFNVPALFSTLRGMMKPLQTDDAVELVFEDPGQLPHLVTDEAKLAQILRNFISNALKFTIRGEVRVRARQDGDALVISVSDTGVGIPAEAQGRIFQEYVQIENPLQRKVKGTGLGLSLCKKLAGLLGGSVGFESRAGSGSTFWVSIPLGLAGIGTSGRVLIVDDEEISRYLIRQSLALPEELIAEVSDGRTALECARRERPAAIFLDLNMPEMEGAAVLDALKTDTRTRDIPVIVVTSRRLTPELRASLGSAAAVLSKEVLTRADAGEVMRTTLAGAGVSVENHTEIRE